MTQQTSPWWSVEAHKDRRSLLLARNAITAQIRTYFETRDFLEVDAGLLQVSPGNETHIHGMAVTINAPDGTSTRNYLHTSPEFAMKKLLAAGEHRIYSLGHVFRDRERGHLHAPEFTMLEWYRTGDSYLAVQEDCTRLLQLAATATGVRLLRYKNQMSDPFLPTEKISVAEAFSRYAGIDVLAGCGRDGSTDRNRLAAAATRAGLTVADDDGWSDIFSRILVAMVEPNLGIGRPAILHEYPRPEAALAAVNERDGRVADRFELYACGVELANGFRELTDAIEQRRRFEVDMDEKERIYGERYPLDEELLAALPSMPPASGVALGFDRVVMLSTGASHIDQVVWTPGAW